MISSMYNEVTIMEPSLIYTVGICMLKLLFRSVNFDLSLLERCVFYICTNFHHDFPIVNNIMLKVHATDILWSKVNMILLWLLIYNEIECLCKHVNSNTLEIKTVSSRCISCIGYIWLVWLYLELFMVVVYL